MRYREHLISQGHRAAIVVQSALAAAGRLTLRRKLSYAASVVAVVTGMVYLGAHAQAGLTIAPPETDTSSNGTVQGASTDALSGPTSDESMAVTNNNNDSGPDQQTSVSIGSDSSSGTSLSVNGEDIDVPDNGRVHKVIRDDNGKTTINISQHSSGDTNSTSMHVHINTESTNTQEED